MVVNMLVEKSLNIPDVPIWRFTVEQYHAMAKAGILMDGDPIELLEGLLVTKMTKNRAHSISTQQTRDVLARVIPVGWYVDDQEPITTTYSEPEPNISVVRGKRGDYPDRHPYPNEVALVVEVSDTTLQRDRTLKLRIYASARIAVYWILNLQEHQLEVYTDPTGTDEQAEYRQQIILHEGDNAPLVIEGQEVARLAVRELLT